MQTPASSRPQRCRIIDEMGRTRTLDSGPDTFECLRTGSEGTLLLGLGPNPAELADDPRVIPPVYWMECPRFASYMPQTEWDWGIPKDWIRLYSVENLPASATVWLYRANTRLFPSYWGPITARVLSIQAASGVSRPDAADASAVVLLPGSEMQMLTSELEAAFRAEGFTPVRLPVNDIAAVQKILADTRPVLYLSINFRGMDADGLIYHLLREAGVPVAAWLVDNPWHILSRFRQPWWRQVSLFVSDDWFVPGLKDHGAASVYHLPLAAWDMDLTPTSPLPETRLTFVGRTFFPEKNAYFAGCSIPPGLLGEARHLLGSTVSPDLSWWLSRLSPSSLWPGNEVRTAGLCADNMSMERRSLWLFYAARFGLTVYGDPGWIALLPRTVQFCSPVDYYHGLGAIYAAARYSLNITSLQLPHGLSQRHFDVWQSGGFLLTDPTPGLSLFPAELTEPVTVPSPAEFRPVLRRLDKDSPLRTHLQYAWRAHLAGHHTYRHRVQRVLEILA